MPQRFYCIFVLNSTYIRTTPPCLAAASVATRILLLPEMSSRLTQSRAIIACHVKVNYKQHWAVLVTLFILWLMQMTNSSWFLNSDYTKNTIQIKINKQINLVWRLEWLSVVQLITVTHKVPRWPSAHHRSGVCCCEGRGGRRVPVSFSRPTDGLGLYEVIGSGTLEV